MSKILFLFLAAASTCAQASAASHAHPGTAEWFNSATADEQIAYFRERCAESGVAQEAQAIEQCISASALIAMRAAGFQI